MANSRATTKKKLKKKQYKCYANEGEKMETLNAQLKPHKAEKEWKTKMGAKNKGNKQKTLTNMVGINPTISMIMNANALNIPIKRQIFKVNQKTQPSIFCLQDTHLTYKEHID